MLYDIQLPEWSSPRLSKKKKKGILSKCKPCFTIFIEVNTASLTTGENTMHVLSNYSGCHQRKTSYISNKLRNKQHGLVLRQSLYRAPKGPLISKSNGGLVEHPWSILPWNKHLNLSYTKHKELEFKGPWNSKSIGGLVKHYGCTLSRQLLCSQKLRDK